MPPSSSLSGKKKQHAAARCGAAPVKDAVPFPSRSRSRRRHGSRLADACETRRLCGSLPPSITSGARITCARCVFRRRSQQHRRLTDNTPENVGQTIRTDCRRLRHRGPCRCGSVCLFGDRARPPGGHRPNPSHAAESYRLKIATSQRTPASFNDNRKKGTRYADDGGTEYARNAENPAAGSSRGGEGAWGALCLLPASRWIKSNSTVGILNRSTLEHSVNVSIRDVVVWQEAAELRASVSRRIELTLESYNLRACVRLSVADLPADVAAFAPVWRTSKCKPTEVMRALECSLLDSILSQSPAASHDCYRETTGDWIEHASKEFNSLALYCRIVSKCAPSFRLHVSEDKLQQKTSFVQVALFTPWKISAATSRICRSLVSSSSCHIAPESKFLIFYYCVWHSQRNYKCLVFCDTQATDRQFDKSIDCPQMACIDDVTKTFEREFTRQVNWRDSSCF